MPNGLQLGVLQTWNAGALESVASLRYDKLALSFHLGANISRQSLLLDPYVVQDIWASMLEDAAFRTKFVERNHELMAKSYAFGHMSC